MINRGLKSIIAKSTPVTGGLHGRETWPGSRSSGTLAQRAAGAGPEPCGLTGLDTWRMDILGAIITILVGASILLSRINK